MIKKKLFYGNSISIEDKEILNIILWENSLMITYYST